ncbi:MAG: hypothetical protein Q6360_16505, partial [Candidatus Brocadiales bacterium]|nr:hypothetical protein [Candidatus Brocadiales bacterium]
LSNKLIFRLTILNVGLTVVLLAAIAYVVVVLPGVKSPLAPAPLFTTGAKPAKGQHLTVETPKTPLERFAASRGLKSITSDVVFVTKGVYGGNLEYSAIMKGRIRNISGRPYPGVLVVWFIYGSDEDAFPVSWGASAGGGAQFSAFLDKIEYLDSKAEADFQIALDLYSGMGSKSAKKVKEAIEAGRHEVGLYVQTQNQ